MKVEMERGEVFDYPESFTKTLEEGEDIPLYLPISDDQIKYAKQFAEKNGQKMNNFGLGNYKSFKGSKEEESFIGFLGETVVCDYIGIDRPEFYPDKVDDDGFDIEHDSITVDVKTARENKEGYHLIATPKRFNSVKYDRITFLQIDKKHKLIRVSIDMSKDKFSEVSKNKNFGYGDRYAIKVRNCPDEFKPSRTIKKIGV